VAKPATQLQTWQPTPNRAWWWWWEAVDPQTGELYATGGGYESEQAALAAGQQFMGD
jgi:hypothetical protein